MLIRPATESDRGTWERMRQALWPSPEGEHAGEIERYFAGKLREPIEVLIAFDDQGVAVGLIELSIRAYAEGCVTDRVAFVEGWYVEPIARRKGLEQLSSTSQRTGRGRKVAQSLDPILKSIIIPVRRRIELWASLKQKRDGVSGSPCEARQISQGQLTRCWSRPCSGSQKALARSPA